MSRLLQRLVIPSPPECETKAERRLATEDLLPVVPSKREWTAWSYTSFWIADSFNVNTFSIASSGMAAGLSWWQTIIATALGYTLAAPFLALNGRQGAMFHIRFPAVARVSFGIWGSYWLVFNRTIMSMIWFGVQSWIGGQCVAVLLQAIFPSYKDIPNGMGGSGTTTKAFLGFFIFWLLSIPITWPPIEKTRYLFTAKAVVAPIGGFTYLIWALVRSKGLGPLVHQAPELTGGSAVFPVISAMMSCMSNMATLITNNPDIAANARRPSDALWPQLITLPFGFMITSLMGILIASSSQVVYGEVIWDPIDHLSRFLDGSPSHATRFGVAVIAICFIYVQLILNLSANSIGAGCDMTALMPKYINIRRGSYICVVSCLIWGPWRLFASSNAFTSYLGAYSVFLSSFCGVMLCDYYLIRKGRYRVTDLYTNSQQGWYYYSKGFNLRAFAAYLVGIAPNMPGFVNAVVTAGGGDALIGEGADKLYAFSWFTGVGVSLVTYYILNMIWPAKGAFLKDRFFENDESEYEEYGFANSPKWSTLDRNYQARDEDYYGADGSSDKKGSGEDESREQVVDVPELRG